MIITRAVVPCSYELVGQMLSRGTLSVKFALTPPFQSRSAGVEKGSIAIDEGPEGVFGPEGDVIAARAIGPGSRGRGGSPQSCKHLEYRRNSGNGKG